MNENNSSTSLNQSNLKKNIQTKPIDHQKSINDQTIKILFGDETKKIIEHKDFSNNRISTTKYNLLIFIPKCLLFQFRRAANIYFLIICFLTSGSFSPKNPYSMIGTFAFVVLLTMFKEAYEANLLDVKRYNSDKETNHRKAFKYNQQKKRFEVVTWDNINVGDIIRILNHDNIPADLLLIKSSLTSGLCFVDTMSLDGETNLKEMRCPSNTKNLTENDLTTLKGEIICEKPNEFLHKWEGTLFIESIPTILGAKQLLLRGSKLKNTEYIYGVVVYTGHSTKIMKNAQNPPLKLSNVMKLMNKLLYSVFIFQLIICLIFSICFILWQVKIGKYQKQLLIYDKDFKTKSLDPNLETLFIKFLTFLVAYSHFIPISLYVALEVVKMIQGLLIFYDDLMLDEMTGKSANSRTSDLIEELGQVQFLFTDKTGTLTRNEMIFKKCSIKNNIFSEIDKGNFKIKELLSKDSIFVNEENEKKSIIDFFTICSVCHSAFIQIYNRNLIYNSESPDEIALIEGAAKAGFKFFNKTSDTIEIQLDSGEYQIWKVILELPFDSTRKRMSVIVQNINNETEKCLYLFTKGADSEILNNLRHSDSENLKEIRDKLHSFAVEGLRCMVLAKKELKSVEVQSILEKFQKIYITCNSETEKEQNLNRLFYEVETEFEYVGITAVEDKLQEGVPETIEKLIKSDIRVWVLTGDKKETSLEIGKASKLINPDMSLIDLTIQFNSNSPQKEMIKLIDQSIEQYLNKNDQKKIAIIVDGPSLVYIFKDHNISQRFIKLGLKANSVICCRVSPKQKAQIVRLARNYTSEITLSIGDGANDVGMIFEANIGVGIHGKEGSSAVRSADYAFSQFRFLQRLLFIHGRLGYRRISLLICYYFYKNIVLVFTEFYFVFFNGFSGQIFFADILPLFYNSFWTSWPCIFCYSLDRDVDDEISLNYTVLYKAGQINYYFNLKKFWVWIIMALIHGAINFSSNMFVKYFLYKGNRFFVDSSGLTKDHWFFSTIAFTCAIHIVTYKIFIDTMNWSKFTMTISFCSIFFYYVSACFICWPHIFNLVQSELNYTIFSMLSVIKTLILIICVPLICLLIDIVIRQYLYNFSPTPSQIIFKNSKKYKNMISNQNLAIQKEEMNCQTVELSKNIDEKQKPLCE